MRAVLGMSLSITTPGGKINAYLHHRPAFLYDYFLFDCKIFENDGFPLFLINGGFLRQ